MSLINIILGSDAKISIETLPVYKMIIKYEINESEYDEVGYMDCNIYYYVTNGKIPLNNKLHDCRFSLTAGIFTDEEKESGYDYITGHHWIAINTIKNLTTFIQCVKNNTNGSIEFMYSSIEWNANNKVWAVGIKDIGNYRTHLFNLELCDDSLIQMINELKGLLIALKAIDIKQKNIFPAIIAKQN